MKKFRKRIIFDVTPEEHAEIKKQAVIRNISMALYIMQAVERRIQDERKYEEPYDHSGRRRRDNRSKH